MRSNNTFIFLVVAIVSFLVYWFFIRKKTVKTPAPTPSSTETPSATMGEAVVTFKPDNDADEPEAYTEYADDTSWAELSGNVTVKLTWDNKAGFNNTTKITIRRVIVDDENNETIYDHVIERYNTDGTVITDNEDYFKNFKSGLTYTVTNMFGSDGGNTAYSVLGKNTYSIRYTLTDGRSEILTEDENGKTTLTDTFSIEDLSLTLDAVAKTERRVKPSLSGGVEISGAVAENLVYLLSKNKVNGKRFAYRDRKYNNTNIGKHGWESWYTRLDRVTNQICNKKKGYEYTDKNAFQLYNELKKGHLAANFTYDNNGNFTGVNLVFKNTESISQECVDGTFCTTFKMVEDQYTKGDTGDDTKYYAFRVSDCNRKTKTPWTSMTDDQKENPDNTRGTGELKSTVDAYLVANPINGKLTLKTLDTMTEQELSEGWHAFETVKVTKTKEATETEDIMDVYTPIGFSTESTNNGFG